MSKSRKRLDCPGLCADSVLGWLAAVGTTVLDKRLRLHWTTDAAPFAVLSSNKDPFNTLFDAWLDGVLLNDMPISPNWMRGSQPMKRNVPVESFRERAKMARRHRHSWVLSSTMTDLQVGKGGIVEHGPFDPPVPQGLTLHDRLLNLHKTLAKSLRKPFMDSLLGQAPRVQGNGLGFDHARLGSLADETDRRLIDPVVEVLAFFGLSLFPVRGDGVDVRPELQKGRQRGWLPFDDNGTTIQRFVWPAWSQPLDSAGIDALLDAWRPVRIDRNAKLLGIHSGWQSVEYEGKSKKDISTKAYGSMRL